CVVFFFSSRRRHTRFSRDWSSDVCSSDLQLDGQLRERLVVAVGELVASLDEPVGLVELAQAQRGVHVGEPVVEAELGDVVRPRRSEERRVGKECRYRWSSYD